MNQKAGANSEIVQFVPVWNSLSVCNSELHAENSLYVAECVCPGVKTYSVENGENLTFYPESSNNLAPHSRKEKMSEWTTADFLNVS